MGHDWNSYSSAFYWEVMMSFLRHTGEKIQAKEEIIRSEPLPPSPSTYLGLFCDEGKSYPALLRQKWGVRAIMIFLLLLLYPPPPPKPTKKLVPLYLYLWYVRCWKRYIAAKGFRGAPKNSYFFSLLFTWRLVDWRSASFLMFLR